MGWWWRRSPGGWRRASRRACSSAVAWLCVAVGLLLMHGVSAHSSWTELLSGLLLAGAGLGWSTRRSAQVAIGVVPPARSGMASGINNTCRQVGIATGIAGLGAVFQHQVQSKVAQHVPGNEAFASGLNAILMIGAILAFVTALIGFALVRRSDLVEGATEAESPAYGVRSSPTKRRALPRRSG